MSNNFSLDREEALTAIQAFLTGRDEEPDEEMLALVVVGGSKGPNEGIELIADAAVELLKAKGCISPGADTSQIQKLIQNTMHIAMSVLVTTGVLLKSEQLKGQLEIETGSRSGGTFLVRKRKTVIH